MDFVSKHDAKNAFDALSHSTHIYGRRLVLEWATSDTETNVDALRKRMADQFPIHDNKRRCPTKTEFKKVLEGGEKILEDSGLNY